MIEHKIFSRFPHTSSESLSSLTSVLYYDQKKKWPMLAEGVSALESVQSKIINCGTFAVRLQFNPKRIVSTGAKVDAASIRERKCFLCLAHLPPEQQGVLYRDTFVLLCNPMPIFKEHYTISHVDHIPQSIEEQIIPFLELAKDFSVSHSIFYNGPKCGASAPDHLHFQATPKNFIPVENEAVLPERRRLRKRVGDVDIFSMIHTGRSVLMLESTKQQELEPAFLRVTGAMRKVMNTAEEPMMNVLCSYSNDTWRIILFPRSKHRPDVYFAEGEAKILISPAAVDIGGLIITPVEKDFRTIDASLVTRMYEEVSVGADTLDQILTIL